HHEVDPSPEPTSGTGAHELPAHRGADRVLPTGEHTVVGAAGVETVLPHGGYILVVSAEHTAVRGDQQPRVAVVAVRVAADEGPGGDRTVPDGEIPQQLGARTVDRQCGVGHQVTEPHA